MHPKLTPVTSSNLDGYAYDPASQKLIIAFKKGTHYLYENVPQLVVDGFAEATSKGNFFGRNIRESFITHQLDEEGVNALLAGFGTPAPAAKARRKSKTKRTAFPVLAKKYPFLRAAF